MSDRDELRTVIAWTDGDEREERHIINRLARELLKRIDAEPTNTQQIIPGEAAQIARDAISEYQINMSRGYYSKDEAAKHAVEYAVERASRLRQAFEDGARFVNEHYPLAGRREPKAAGTLTDPDRMRGSR